MAKSNVHTCDRVLSLAMQPWALTRDMLFVVANVLGQRLAGEAADLEAFDRRLPTSASMPGAVAVIPVHGVIAPRMNLLSEISGGATFDALGAALDAAVADDSVSTIVLDIDSPGGSVLGATEFAHRMRAARNKKRIIAHANYQMCSAAYWIAANATEIVAAPSSVIGSIGVYSIHKDLSAALEKSGVKLTYISAGKYKIEGNPAEPLTESALAHAQSQVDSFYGRFVADVCAGRNVGAGQVKHGYGEGLALTSDEALGEGLIDSIATFEDTLAAVLPSSTPVAALAGAPPPPSLPASPTATATRAAQARQSQRALLSLGL